MENVWPAASASGDMRRAARDAAVAEGTYYLGLRFYSGPSERALREILNETAGRFKYVVTPNVHHMVRLLDDRGTLWPLYERAWRVFCDSRVLSRLARFEGLDLPVITGSDLTAQLVAQAAQKGLKIALIGPPPAARAALEQRYPGIDVELITPPMGFITSEVEVQRCVDFVVQARAPLTLLAVGMPQQEILAARIAEHPKARGIGLCIGASVDFLTGKQQRAPVWIQKAGFEWLHRLLSDPQRLASRYLLECPRIFYLIWWGRRKSQLGNVR